MSEVNYRKDPSFQRASHIQAIGHAKDSLEVQKLIARSLVDIVRELQAINETLKAKAE